MFGHVFGLHPKDIGALDLEEFDLYAAYIDRMNEQARREDQRG